MNILKIFTTEIPVVRCCNCIFYKSGIYNNKSYCKIYKNIVEARLDETSCGIEAKSFRACNWITYSKKN